MTKAYQFLKQYYGYDHFRPYQLEVIAQCLSGKDVVLVMPTGGGKSLCFQLPSLLLGKLVIVVSPLIALMKDQVDSLRSNGFEAAALNSSFTSAQEREVLDCCFEGRMNLLYLSPERLVSEISMLKQLNIGLFAIDEAHCISSWGHDFRPEYAQLKVLKDTFPNVPVMALTATADKITRKDIVQQLGLTNPSVFVASFNRPNLSLNVRPGLASRDKYREITNFIRNHPGQSGIIYCLSRKETEKMAAIVHESGVSSAFYHAGMNSESRKKVQEDFINDQVQVITATIAFGLGIDKPDVRWVIHNNLPKNIESFYQEIGRSGRDGLESETILYYNVQDLIMLRQFAESSGQRELQLEKLERMQQYAEADICRRKILISYFGEAFEENCGNCDVCRNPRDHFDGTVIAQKAISALLRMNENAGVHLLIDVLRGSKRAEVLENNYHKLKTWGAGAIISYYDWQAYILQMLNLGLFEMAYDDNFSLKVTPYGKDIVFGLKTIELVKPKAKERITGRKKLSIKDISISTVNEVTADEKLKDALRLMRRKLAVEKQVPPYIIFNDNTLNELVNSKPLNRLQLLDITGISNYKADEYGSPILDTILSIIGKIRHSKGETYLETYTMLKDGMGIEEIARQRNLSIPTIFSHIAVLVAKGENIDIYKFVSQEDIDKISKAKESIVQTDILKEYFDFLNGEVPYGIIRLALAKLDRK
ncbi:MAG: DNA helicase RecQ [Bacteroidetes bacterium]|nr:DNA helicase RecQ [Bacteroidota bacterium]